MPPFGTHESSPVLDALTQRRLKALGLNVTLTVRVDSNGKVLTLAFSPPVDPQTRARVVAMLAKASWDPAVCGGGLPCAGEATIRI